MFLSINKPYVLFFAWEGPSSTISTVHTYEGSKNNTIEVGQGNLKLLYSADEGKLTRYVNSRNLVSYAVYYSVWLCPFQYNY